MGGKQGGSSLHGEPERCALFLLKCNAIGMKASQLREAIELAYRQGNKGINTLKIQERHCSIMQLHEFLCSRMIPFYLMPLADLV